MDHGLGMLILGTVLGKTRCEGVGALVVKVRDENWYVTNNCTCFSMAHLPLSCRSSPPQVRPLSMPKMSLVGGTAAYAAIPPQK